MRIWWANATGNSGCSAANSGVVILDVVAGLADDFDVPDHGVLNHFVAQERRFIDVLDVAVNAVDRFPNRPQVVRQPRLVAGHTGTAWASTVSRNFSGRAFGVSTSTGTPKSWSSSCWIAPMSNNVVWGGGVDEQVQIAALRIAPTGRRPKDPRIAGAVGFHHPTDGFSVSGKG